MFLCLVVSILRVGKRHVRKSRSPIRKETCFYGYFFFLIFVFKGSANAIIPGRPITQSPFADSASL